MSEDQILRILEQHTRPRADAVARVHERAMASAGAADTLLKAVPGPSVGAAARVRRRLAAPTPPPQRSRWVLPIGGLALVAAAAVLWMVVPAEQQVEARDLGAEAVVQLTPEVVLEVDGEGAVQRTPRRAPVVEWRAGAIDVEVEPEQGIEFVVRTPEADVTVLGTRFEVDRSALGTRVTVERGKVAVDCVEGERTELVAGQSVTCLPVRPAQLLGRARALMADGAAEATVQESVRRGLAEAQGAVRAELLIVQLELAIVGGRHREALEIGRLYLSEGHETRRGEVEVLVPELAQRLGEEEP